MFLLVVLGAALFLYSPSAKPAPAVASTSPVEKRMQSGWNERDDGGFQNNAPVAVPDEIKTAKVNDMYVVSDNTTVVGLNSVQQQENQQEGTTIDLNSLKNELAAENRTPQNINITVNIPDSAKAQNPEENTAPSYTAAEQIRTYEEPVYTAKADVRAEPAPVPAKTASESVREKPAPAKKASSVQVKKAEPKTAPAKAAAVAEPAKKITRYWVQAASFSSKQSADNARAVLDSNKIPADIFTYRDNSDRLFYRVRVGPYTTKSEAEYWRTKIVAISEFSSTESYITSTIN